MNMICGCCGGLIMHEQPFFILTGVVGSEKVFHLSCLDKLGNKEVQKHDI